MKRSLLLAAVVFSTIGVSSSQRISYKPFTLKNPGPVSPASSSVPEPGRPDQVAALSFLPEDFHTSPSASGLLEWLDVDADNDLDYLLVDGTIKLYENIGQYFYEVAGAGLDMTVTAHYVADLNHDNRIDIMFIQNRMIKIAYNNGDKTFTVADTGITIDWDGAPPLYCLDVDNDADLDILTRPASDFYAFIPNQTYGTTEAIAYPPEFKFMSFENLDNYGVLDFFLVYTDNAGYSVLSTGLTSGLVYEIAGTAPTFNFDQNEVRWVDVDLDDDLDLFARTASGWRFFMNSYTTNSTVQLSYSASFPNSVSGHAAVGDLNSDGKPDFVVTNSSTNKIDVWRNQSSPGNPLFVLDHSIPVTSFSRLYILDMDGQAGLDIVSHAKIYKNTLLLGNVSMPPYTPTGLSCRYVGDRLYLTWSKSGIGLQYRYEVFRDGEMIISSESADNGTPLRLQRAPGLQTTTVILSPLPPGDYSFRVQAVDASYRGSPFSVVREEEVPVGLESTVVFKVYPNPASDQFQVSIPAAGKITVRDNLSRIVFQREEDAGTLTIAAGDWSGGIYSIQFEAGGERIVQKLVVTR